MNGTPLRYVALASREELRSQVATEKLRNKNALQPSKAGVSFILSVLFVSSMRSVFTNY